MTLSHTSKRIKPRNPIARNLSAFRAKVVPNKKRYTRKGKHNEKEIATHSHY